jgi:hypothetical protein
MAAGVLSDERPASHLRTQPHAGRCGPRVPQCGGHCLSAEPEEIMALLSETELVLVICVVLMLTAYAVAVALSR